MVSKELFPKLGHLVQESKALAAFLAWATGLEGQGRLAVIGEGAI